MCVFVLDKEAICEDVGGRGDDEEDCRSRSMQQGRETMLMPEMLGCMMGGEVIP